MIPGSHALRVLPETVTSAHMWLDQTVVHREETSVHMWLDLTVVHMEDSDHGRILRLPIHGARFARSDRRQQPRSQVARPNSRPH